MAHACLLARSYLGEGEDAFDGQIVLSFWKDGADAPSFWFFKDALEEEKV